MPFAIFAQIVNWRTHLKFPDEAKLTPEARDMIERLLCDVEHRLGTRSVQEIKVSGRLGLVMCCFEMGSQGT